MKDSVFTIDSKTWVASVAKILKYLKRHIPKELHQYCNSPPVHLWTDDKTQGTIKEGTMFAIVMYKDNHLYAVGRDIDNKVVIQDFKTYKPNAEDISNVTKATNNSILEKFNEYFQQDFHV